MTVLRERSWRSACARCFALLMSVSVVFESRPVFGEPADIFALPAPTIGAAPPKAADIKTGDASVSTQTGAAQYSYPIRVPPGRGSSATPQLALTYSSQAPVFWVDRGRVEPTDSGGARRHLPGSASHARTRGRGDAGQSSARRSIRELARGWATARPRLRADVDGCLRDVPGAERHGREPNRGCVRSEALH